MLTAAILSAPAFLCLYFLAFRNALCLLFEIFRLAWQFLRSINVQECRCNSFYFHCFIIFHCNILISRDKFLCYFQFLLLRAMLQCIIYLCLSYETCKSFPRAYASERVTGRKARGLQTEERGCTCQTFLSLLSGRRKTQRYGFPSLYKLKRRFLLTGCVAKTPGLT